MPNVHAVGPVELYLFTADAEVAAEAVAEGAAGVVVDWEQRAKRERQAGFDTQVNADTPEDLRRVRAATDGRVLCRVNGWGPWSPDELALAADLGADEVLLPMVRRPEEVDRALDALGGACGLGILVETLDAVACVDELATRPLSRLYVGLNDLMIERRTLDLFVPLVDGTVDRVRTATTCPFGVAGLTVPGGGRPVPTELLAGELGRLDAAFTFLRRSFLADAAGRGLAGPLAEVAAMVAAAGTRGPDDVAADRAALLRAVPVPAPAG